MSEDDPCGGESALYGCTDGGEDGNETNYVISFTTTRSSTFTKDRCFLPH